MMVAMSFKLRRQHGVGKELRRVAGLEVRLAAQSLRQASDPAKAVHDARRRIKRVRAVVRLLRPTLGESWYDRENSPLRLIARELGPGRDAAVLIQTLDRLIDQSPRESKRRSLLEARAEVESHADALRQQSPDEAAVMDRAAKALEDAQRRIAGWPVDDLGISALRSGLRHSYRQGRRRMAQAVRKDTDEAYHTWRKRVKDLLYQLTLLSGKGGKHLRPLLRQLDQLAETLGEDHDLAVLSQASASTDLHRTTRARQVKLRRRAERLGSKVYSAAPTRFVEAILQPWVRWHKTATGR